MFPVLNINPARIKAFGAALLISFFVFSCSQKDSVNGQSSITAPPTNSYTALAKTTANGSTIIEGTQQSGAVYKIYIPKNWNRELVMFAHGYVEPEAPVGIPESQLMIDDSTYLPDVMTNLGYAFAVTSYSVNGLAVKEGIADLADLHDIFKNEVGRARYTYLVGVSEGGLITTLSMEKNFFLYSGALSLCGPSGDFQKQLNYFGDFRVLFDYYFPGVLPGDATHIPQELMDNWDSKYVPAILTAIQSNPFNASQVLRVSGAPIDPQDDTSVAYTFLSVLWYSTFATNNANDVLGGNAYDNSDRVYKGGFGMKQLNASIPRYMADATALNNVANDYQTSGIIFKPMIMMHTLGDQIVLKEQMDLYAAKIDAGSAEFLTTQSVPRYGHCNFTAKELMLAFDALVYKVTGQMPGVSQPEKPRPVHGHLAIGG